MEWMLHHSARNARAGDIREPRHAGVDVRHLRVVVGAAIEWHVILGTSLATRLLNVIAAAIPERAWQMPAVLRFMAVAAQATLGTGRLNFVGLTPNGTNIAAITAHPSTTRTPVRAATFTHVR